MTLPYLAFPFERALQGISAAGYRYVAFGLPHAGRPVPNEWDPGEADSIRRLLERYGLTPVMLVSTEQLAPGQPIERAVARLSLAKALGIGELLSLGTWGYREYPDDPYPEEEMDERNRAFAEKFAAVAREAERLGVTVTLKPHTGNTATAVRLKRTLEQIGSHAVKASYDPGNVRYYEGIDPLSDFPLIAPDTVSVVAKDHRGGRGNVDFPPPGEGDVDFARLIEALKKSDFSGPLVVERVDVPDAGPSPGAERIDEAVSVARSNLLRLLQDAGYEAE